MRIGSFGCSFTAGTDLFDPEQTWPNIVAQRLGVMYINHAEPGIGNLRIAESVLQHTRPGDVCIINWTWIDRFDFVDSISETWKTILPVDINDYTKTYYRYLHSQYRDMLCSLMQAVALVDYLERNNVKFMMTMIDDLWFETVNEAWHEPRAVSNLQSRLIPYTHRFGNKNFLDWARDAGFPISDAWHPLDQAHDAAADIMQPIVYDLLYNKNSRS